MIELQSHQKNRLRNFFRLSGERELITKKNSWEMGEMTSAPSEGDDI